uniref:Uncharacterized protein n=1 Tax=viral metagenome TaxID=1070528 RepID=A0A6H1ZUY5_9ZZZZ
MAKIISKEDIRVVVYPVIGYGTTPDKEIEDCKEIQKNIRRHIDAGKIELKYSIVERCEFCDYTWEENEKGRPECCDKAVKEWEKEEKEEEND